jgi:cellulose synthase/poly-beta-1,6-N-acetylglucosamine synthase-like glycosyltransferase
MINETHRNRITDSERDNFFPLVSIVIPVYNGTRTVRLCLDAIQRLDYPKERYEVVIVDNNSTDGTPEIVSQYPVRLLYERELQGPHAATNTGVRQAKGEIIVFTDSDCVPEPDWLRKLVAPFRDADVVATGGKIEAYQPTTRVEKFLQYEVGLFKNCLHLVDSFPVSIITGNAAYRASALHQVGLFNANMYTGSEVDLAWRVQWATGKKVIYVDRAIVYHIFKPTVRRMFRHFRIYGYSEIMLGTLYKDVPGYPRPPKVQLRVMLSQGRALLTYLASLVYRSLIAPFHKRGFDYITTPALWLVAESGSICGKLEALWATRFYRKQFWTKGPRVI